jgi:hypothetical protein
MEKLQGNQVYTYLKNVISFYNREKESRTDLIWGVGISRRGRMGGKVCGRVNTE